MIYMIVFPRYIFFPKCFPLVFLQGERKIRRYHLSHFRLKLADAQGKTELFIFTGIQLIGDIRNSHYKTLNEAAVILKSSFWRKWQFDFLLKSKHLQNRWLSHLSIGKRKKEKTYIKPEVTSITKNFIFCHFDAGICTSLLTRMFPLSKQNNHLFCVFIQNIAFSPLICSPLHFRF